MHVGAPVHVLARSGVRFGPDNLNQLFRFARQRCTMAHGCDGSPASITPTDLDVDIGDGDVSTA